MLTYVHCPVEMVSRGGGVTSSASDSNVAIYGSVLFSLNEYANIEEPNRSKRNHMEINSRGEAKGVMNWLACCRISAKTMPLVNSVTPEPKRKSPNANRT
jgi:hypothetical protein